MAYTALLEPNALLSRFYSNYYYHNYSLQINGAFLQGVSSMFNYLLAVHPLSVLPLSD